MRMNVTLAAMAGMSALLFAACTAPAAEAVDLEKVKAEIQAMEDAFAAGEKAKDADAVVAYYSDDAISYSPNMEPASGKAAIRERIANRLAADTTGNYSVYKVVDLFAEGNSLVEIGSWKTYNAGGTETENGYYMSYFQKKDGKFHCVRDMNMTTKPAK